MPKPALLDQPGGAGLDRAVGLRQRGASSGTGRRLLGGEERVGEERAGAPRVVVGRVEDHPLAAPQAEHGLADGGERGPAAGLDAERPRQLGVARPAPPGEPVGAGRSTESTTCRPGSALKPLLPVAEAAVGVEGHDVAGRAVPARAPTAMVWRPPGRRRRRSGSGWPPTRPGMPESASTPDQPRSTALDDVVPASPAATSTRHGHSTARRTGRRSVGLTPRVATSTTRPSKPSSATTRLLPPPSTSTGLPAASASADRVDQLGLGGGPHPRGPGPPRRRVVWSRSRTGRPQRTDDGPGHAEHLRALAGDLERQRDQAVVDGLDGAATTTSAPCRRRARRRAW